MIEYLRALYIRIIPIDCRIIIRRNIHRVQGYNILQHPLEPIYVRPENISYCSKSRFIPEKYYLGSILDGKWDQKRTPIENTATYIGLHERFVEDNPWEETKYYLNAKEKIKKEGEYFGYTDSQEFLETRCQFVEELYDSLETNGYQYEDDHVPYDPNRPWSRKDPTGISVLIARDGEILLHDGHHRLTLSRILKIEKVPVHVLVRHKKWQLYKEKIRTKNSKNLNPEHPDIMI